MALIEIELECFAELQVVVCIHSFRKYLALVFAQVVDSFLEFLWQIFRHIHSDRVGRIIEHGHGLRIQFGRQAQSIAIVRQFRQELRGYTRWRKVMEVSEHDARFGNGLPETLSKSVRRQADKARVFAHDEVETSVGEHSEDRWFGTLSPQFIRRHIHLRAVDGLAAQHAITVRHPPVIGQQG